MDEGPMDRGVAMMFGKAMGAAEDVSELVDGDLRATIEHGTDHRSRRVTVESPEGTKSMVLTYPDAQRPSFFPEDVPFLEGVQAVISNGIVMWTVGELKIPNGLQDLTQEAGRLNTDGLRDLMARMKEAPKEEKAAVVQDFIQGLPDSFRQLIETMAQEMAESMKPGSESPGAELARRALGELESDGWVSSAREGEMTWDLRREGQVRTLTLGGQLGHWSVSLLPSRPDDEGGES